MDGNRLEIKRALIRFREFGGMRLVREYARYGILLSVVKAILCCVKKRRSLKTVYSVVLDKVERILTDRYSGVLLGAVTDNSRNSDTQSVPTLLWTCWLQGMEQAPAIIRACVDSQRSFMKGYEQRVLTLDNYRQWVEVPDFVEDKYARGVIPAALFSDILRVAVLKRYGGVWMDASVLCTGFDSDLLRRQWQEVMDSRFTVCRFYAKGAVVPTGLSNWFIVAVPECAVLDAVYTALTAYWRDYDCVVDYYMMHLFISVALKHLPQTEHAMPKLNSRYCFMLGNSLGKNFHEKAWEDLTAHVGMHKLNYRKANKAMKNSNSYCNFIVRNFQNDIRV